MKYKIEFEGDTQTESITPRLFVHSGDMYRALTAVRIMIKKRIPLAKDEELQNLKAMLDRIEIFAFEYADVLSTKEKT